MEIHVNKFLTFLLDDEIYGIPIRKVREIIGLLEITHIPRTKGYIKGVVNLRGKIVPVVDMRLKFGMEAKDYTDRTCLIIVQIDLGDTRRLVGMAVDAVAEVIKIQEDEIDPPPKYESQIEGDFLLGLGKVKERVILLLNIDRILNQMEITYLRQGLPADNGGQTQKRKTAKKV